MKNKYEIRGDVTAIFLTRRDKIVIETLIDTTDLEKANSFNGTWYAAYSPTTDSFYVNGQLQLGYKKQKSIRLHRLLFDNPKGLVIDHINHDTLDNRIQNLRMVTHAQNLQNLKGAKKNNKTSKIMGVSFNKGLWTSRVTIEGKRVHLGNFENIEDAKNAVEKARSKYIPYSKESRYIIVNDGEKLLFDDTKARRSNNYSKVKNVHWHKKDKTWAVTFTVNGKQVTFGRYLNLEEAAKKANEVRDALKSQTIILNV